MSQYASAMNRRSGWTVLTRPIRLGQYSLAGGGPARAPHVRPNTSFLISIAMSQRSPSHCRPTSISVSATASRSRRVRVQLHDVGPRREIRIPASGEDPPGVGPDERLGMLCELLLGAGEEAFGPLPGPRMVGRDMIGDVVEDQAEPALRQGAARRLECRGAAKAIVHHVVADAI